MKVALIILIMLVTLTTSFAQKGFYQDYEWASTPKKYAISEQERLEDEVIVFEKRSVQLVHTNEGFIQYDLSHYITLLNTDKAIEENNKFYISNNAGSKVFTQKARVIRLDGKIIELKEADIKENKDEAGNVEYRYFALDGIEKGCFIEYLQYVQREPDFSGAAMTLQSEVKKKEVQLDIISPKYIEYLIHPVNGMPEFKKDSSDYLLRRMYLNVNDVPGLEEEPWSAHNSQLQKCYYKVQRNTDERTSNFYNYTNVTKNIHQNMYEPANKKAKKLMEGFIKKACPDDKAALDVKIRSLENKMKSEISVVNDGFDGAFDVAKILEQKVTHKSGLTKLMIQSLREMGIAHELILTSNRNENPFLSNFEGYNFLDENLVYINDLDLYWSPEFESRLGFPPFDYTNTLGLFIKEVKVNELVTAVSKVKQIKGTKGEQSVDEINMNVTFNPDLSGCDMQLERKTTGYKAEYPQVLFDFVDDERKTKLREEYLKYVDQDAVLEGMTFENDRTTAAGVLPLIGKAHFNGAAFLEKAGDKMLLKAGLLIGPQAELYHPKNARKLPVETRYTRQYKRTITIQIPDGYTVKNPQDLNFNVKPDEKNNTSGFTSTAEIKGNVLTVNVQEWYNQSSYPASEFFIYEKVMNTAADFNKVVLVFVKK